MAVVLIIEDEAPLRASMARGLAKLEGVEVVEAGGVAQALRLLQSARPLLVVSDLDLPDGSGIEVLNAIERSSVRVPIIFVSGHLDRFVQAIPLRADVEMHAKPLELEALRSIVSDRLGSTAHLASPEPFSVDDYIQLACMGQHSILIRLEDTDKLFGEIVVQSGQVWSAVDRRGVGEQALERMKGAFGQVRCEAIPGGVPVERNVPPRPSIVAGATPSGPPPSPSVAPRPIISLSPEGWGSPSRPPPAASPAPEAMAVAAPVAAPAGAAPSAQAPTPAAEPEPTARTEFDVVFERGIEAALNKRYEEALRAFLEAARLEPGNPRVEGNIARLRKMGYSE
jgi:CheY-like chemotaxis protein